MQKINNLLPKIEKYKSSIELAVARVIASGWFILGPELQNFEKRFAAYLGADYCMGVANGTDAIELSLRALGICAGDRVATVANAGMYTTTAVLAIGAVPVFMDVDIKMHNTTLAEVMAAISSGVKAVVVTHLYGLAVAEIEAIADYCAKNNVPLLEDCAQAHGAKIKNKQVGTFGDVASFSFYPTKNLGALGDAGAVVTQTAAIAEKIKLLRQYGWIEKYKVGMVGARNSRLDEFQAAILAEILPHLDADNTQRREIATRYSLGITHPKVVIPAPMHEEYVAHLYVIRSQQRDSLRANLQQHGIATDIHYPIPDHKQPILKEHYKDSQLKNTEQLAAEIITIPCYPEMRDTEVQHVIRAINSWRS